MLTPDPKPHAFKELAEIDRLRAEVERAWAEQVKIQQWADDRITELRAEVERLVTNNGMCHACGEWCGRGYGCESCAEFAEESGWNARVSAETKRLTAERDELVKRGVDALMRAERAEADAERLAGAGDKLRRIVSGGWVPSERNRQAKIAGWDEALRQHEEREGGGAMTHP